MPKKALKYYIQLFITDFIILNISFFSIYYYRCETFILSPIYYVKLLVSFYIIWFIVSFLTKKYQFKMPFKWIDIFLNISRNVLFMAYGVSFMVVILSLPKFSRLQVYGSIFVFYLVELILLSLLYFTGVCRVPRVEAKPDADEFKKKVSLCFPLVLIDFLVLSSLFIGINYVKRGTFILSDEYQELLLIIWGLWFLTSLATNKFQKALLDDYKGAISACLKSVVLMAFSMAFLIFFLRMFFYSRGQIFGSFLLLFGSEIIFYFLYANFYHLKMGGEDIESIEDVRNILGQEALDIDSESQRLPSERIESVKDKLYHVFDFFNPWLYKFIEKNIPIEGIPRDRTAIFQSHEIGDIKDTSNNSLLLFINLAKVNDVRWVNRYFLEVYAKLKAGGYFVGNAETIALHRKRFFWRFPEYIAEPLYFLNYLYRRVWPKLSGFNKVYFAITKGRNRLISRAEILGRLFFCGFNVVAEVDQGDRLYFIARKLKKPSVDLNPTFGPLVRLKRTGLGGKPITVYKCRTMYPFSEYLQEYVFNIYGTKDGDKIINDFRITEWGKIFRKLWIDELPMLFNYLRGDLKIVGVRPLSGHKLSIYPSVLQEKRKNVKPGLLPPFYADLPKTPEAFFFGGRKISGCLPEKSFYY